MRQIDEQAISSLYLRNDRYLLDDTIIRRDGRPIYDIIKRASDIVLSFGALVVLSPLFALVAILIKLEDGGPVIYTRICEGRDGRKYKMYKFRSMQVDAGDLAQYFTEEQMRYFEREQKLDHDPRITKTGLIIRKCSMDELPQLLSILKGDMSLVGPRPLIAAELENYGCNKKKILNAKPGLTGYWQCHGRSNITYENGERQKMELYYVDNRSLILDIKIVLRTVLVVLRREGAK